MSDTDWRPDPARQGWETKTARAESGVEVEVSRPSSPQVVARTPEGVGIRLAVMADVGEISVHDADGKPFEQPCVDDQPHDFAEPFTCHDPTQLGHKCNRCRKIKYVPANGVVRCWGVPTVRVFEMWGQRSEYESLVFHYRFSLGGT